MANLHKQTNPASSDLTQLANSIVTRLDRPLALVGLMGSGKSAVGRRTAKRLGLDFVDSDQKIVSDAGIGIAEIFELAGEAKFREMYIKQLTSSNLKSSQPAVVHFIFPSRKSFVNQKLVIWLRRHLRHYWRVLMHRNTAVVK